ncbi:MAG: hypothetical protein ACJ8ET_10390 [Sphingomicrobium sp.]
MRRLAPVLTLFLAACAARPEVPAAAPAPVTAPRSQVRSSIVGLTASELVGHFGNPALQVREGTSLKLQFRGSSCILDAYLYPSDTGGVQRVTYVDTRLSSGAATDQAACIAALEI